MLLFFLSIFILKVANFYVSGFCCSYIETFDTDMNSDISLPSQFSSHTSDGSIFISTSESSYSSDQGSGNEDAQDAVIYVESSDEIDFPAL